MIGVWLVVVWQVARHRNGGATRVEMQHKLITFYIRFSGFIVDELVGGGCSDIQARVDVGKHVAEELYLLCRP